MIKTNSGPFLTLLEWGSTVTVILSVIAQLILGFPPTNCLRRQHYQLLVLSWRWEDTYYSAAQDEGKPPLSKGDTMHVEFDLISDSNGGAVK